MKDGYKNNDYDSTATPNLKNNITPDVTWDLLPEYDSDDIENSAEFSSASSENLYLDDLTRIPQRKKILQMQIRYYFINFFRIPCSRCSPYFLFLF